MADTLRPLGPWPRGLNNVDDPQSRRFQPPDPNSPRPEPADLREAVNLDLDRDGWLRRRVGRTKRLELTDGHSLYRVGSRLVLVDAGDLVAVDPRSWDRTILQAGVGSGALSLEAVAGEWFWCNGTARGRLDGLGQPTFWGLDLPVVSGSRVPGGLRAGRYLFTVTVECNGIESGARQPQVIDLPDASAILLGVTNLDSNATHMNLYCSEPNGQTLYWVDRVVSTNLVQISSVLVSADPLTTFNHYPPPTGHLVRAHAGRLLVADKTALYWSQPLAYHHFDIGKDVQLFDTPIRLLEPLEGGFYVATDSATWWVAGDDPEGWQPREVDSGPVASGAIRLPGYKIPGLESAVPVAVWATANGFVVGLPGGQLRPLTDGRVAMNAHAKAAFAYREEDGIRQILGSLQQQTEASRFGASDRMTCRVIKAGCEG